MAEGSFLVFGGEKGWLGSLVCDILKQRNIPFHIAKSRLEDRTGIIEEIELHKPEYILNAAGVTGRPNVDWCEDHKEETIRSNVIGTLNLCDVASMKGIHVTNFSSGCIYEYDETHKLGDGNGFKEEDTPNFTGSFYSMTKGMVEKLLQNYRNVLTLRIRMPLSDDLHPRNFITKITKYQKVVNIPNSMTILHDLLPISVEMTLRKLKGIYNFTNPGAISHNEILELYKQHIDPNFTWTNFTVEEQDQILKAKRSNNLLDTSKLEKEFPDLKNIHESIILLFQRMATIEVKTKP
eukprot:TRINITY_DN21398_c0_g1_i1.p1 TRINITY_DN21398_c0_g1~~TRINITY_DN21398_c0_g1_i1.p1  ORF type:complete len:294 (-),score=79.88 TRINITY_DN21398_c0_g1_i1:32-913(-)